MEEGEGCGICEAEVAEEESCAEARGVAGVGCVREEGREGWWVGGGGFEIGLER